MSKETAGDKSRKKILNAGLDLWPNVTVTAVASRANMTHANVLYHFPQGTLKDAIAKHAVKTNHSKVILQLIASGHKSVTTLSPCERMKHFKSV